MICPACRHRNLDDADTCFHCGQALGTRPIVKGSRIASRYEVLSELGRGGMGLVYLAQDHVLEEQVALKVLRGEAARSEAMGRRFRSEIKLARRVRHRNVCGIHEYGEDAGLRYIAMEYVDGINLRQVLNRRGPLPVREVAEIASQVAAGLQAIHETGIIHRDLKTPNVMQDAAGQVRLMDFGIAKQADATTSATATGQVLGTPEYMSPEQARGEKVDFRSDLYALGILVYELLTGTVPFHADTPLATILQHLNDPPPLEGGAADRIPPAVRPVLARALAKAAAGRQPSVAAFAEELRAAVSLDDPAPPVSPRVVAVSGGSGSVLHTEPLSGPMPTPMPTPVPTAARTAVRTAVHTRAQPAVMARDLAPPRGGGRAWPAALVAGGVLAGAGVALAVFFTTRPAADPQPAGATPPTLAAPPAATAAVPATTPPPQPLREEPSAVLPALREPPRGAPVTRPAAPAPPVAAVTPTTLPPLPTRREPAPARAEAAEAPPLGVPPATQAAALTAPVATAPPQPLPEPAAGYGFLYLEVKPEALVAIDGESAGKRRAHTFKLDAGVHVVVFTHPKFQPLSRRVKVTANEKVRLVVDLKDEAVALK